MKKKNNFVMSSMSDTTRSSEVKVKLAHDQYKKAEKHVESTRTLDYLFEKELINKQNKHIHIMDTFGPSRNTHYLSTKFYARHEQHSNQNTATFMPFLYGSSYKHNTEANVYGWMPKTINNPKLLSELNSVSAPKQRCCLTIFGEKLDSDKDNARPSFNGVRFFLQ